MPASARRARRWISRSSCRRGSALGSIRYWMFGRSKLATNWPAPGQPEPGHDLGPGRAGRGGGQRDPRHARASARAARTASGSRAGSRAPTATRSAPRRWRTARSCRGPAGAAWTRRSAVPVPGRAGPGRPRRSRPRPGGARAGSWVELRNPARTPSARSASTWSCISAISGEIDHAGAGPHQRGDLVAQRLAAAGGHQHQRVAAADQVLDHILLVTAERVVAEHAVQHLQRVAHRGVRLGWQHPAILRPIRFITAGGRPHRNR